ncbi:hypothetical protein [Pseudomonas purpurea]|uniref:hypothetical protein n=1 Tax=Pseudomonas purpurea TaxID=3136737 RepID=UPI003266CA6C
MTVQVTAPAKRLALPDPLPPLTVKQAPDNQNLDPLRVDRDEALTAEIPTEGLESTDQFYIDVVGAPGTHPDASYTLGPIPLGGVRPREVNLRASIVALLLKKLVTLSYRIVRGAQEKPSEPLELRVSALEVKVPVARILEAQGNGHGFELDLTSGTRDLTARLDRWPLLAKDQLVWVTLKGKDAEGNDHILALLAPPAGTVSQRWEDLGYHELPIDRGYLAKLGHDTTLTIEQRVACDRVNDADAAVVFADRIYAVKNYKLAITKVTDSQDRLVADESETTDTTLKLEGTAQKGARVDIYVGPDVVATDVAVDGKWKAELSGLTLNTHVIKAVAGGQDSNIWSVTVALREPAVKEANGSASLNPVDAVTELTVIVPGTLLPQALLSVSWAGAAGTPDGGSHATVPAEVSTIGQAIKMPVSMIAFNLGTTVTVTYTVTQHGTSQTSEPLTLAVERLPETALKKPVITQASDSGEGTEWDVTDLTANGTVRAYSCPHMAVGPIPVAAFEG